MYPDSDLNGCLFHLSKNIYKRVKDFGLTNNYLNDQVFRENVRMVCTLAFVPLEDVEMCFGRLFEHCGLAAEAPVLD